MLPLAAASLALAAAGGVYSLIQGGIQGKKAKGLRSEYDSYEKSIPMQDPNQVAFLGDVRRRRRSFDAGTDPLTQFTAQQARNMGAQTQANMVRGGIGNVNNLLRSQNATNRALGSAGADASRRSDSLFAMEGQLVDSMADSAYNRQLSRANRLWSEYARAREDSNSSTQAGIGMLVGGGMTALDMASGGGPKTADAATRMRRREADGFKMMSPIQSQIPTAPLPPLSPLGYNP